MSFLRISSEGGLAPIVPRQRSIATARGNPPPWDDDDIGKDPNKSYTADAKSCMIEGEQNNNNKSYQFHAWHIYHFKILNTISQDSRCCITTVWILIMICI